MPWEKQFDVDAALGRAMEAFWSQGFEATSTQDLLARMGINRGSLYDTFGSKRELFLKALKHYQATYQGPKVAAAARGRTPRETIGALFDGLVAEALGELPKPAPETVEAIRARVAELQKGVGYDGDYAAWIEAQAPKLA